jgi:hypothetical protein
MIKLDFDRRLVSGSQPASDWLCVECCFLSPASLLILPAPAFPHGVVTWSSRAPFVGAQRLSSYNSPCR